MLRREGIYFQPKKQFECFYFAPNRARLEDGWGDFKLAADSKGDIRRYKGGSRRGSGRTVRREIRDKKHGGVLCYRHHAAGLRFHRFGDAWFLEISPTYYYSSDGEKPSPLHAYQLAGMKVLERNNAVIAQIRIWEALLQDRPDMYRDPYPWLGFGALVNFDVQQGIPDDQWKPLPIEDQESEGELLESAA